MAVTGSFDFEFLPRPSRLFDGAALPRHRRLIVNFQSKNLACSGRRSTKIRNIDCTVWPNRHRRRNYEPYQYLFHFARRVDANELRVISRTSVMQFKGVHRPLKDIARELGVDGILEGSVLNSDGRVRVNCAIGSCSFRHSCLGTELHSGHAGPAFVTAGTGGERCKRSA